MNVILINHLLEPANKITGISNYLFYLLDKLLENSDNKYVLVTTWDEDKLPLMLRERGLIVETSSYINSLPLNLLNQIKVLKKQVGNYNVDLVFNPNPIGSKIKGIPQVSVTHDMYFNISPESYKVHHRLWWIIFYPITMKASTLNICVSDNTKKDVINYYPKFKEKLRVIKEAACLKKTISSHSNRTAKGLFVANVSPNKGAKILVEALKLLQDSGLEVQINHVGTDSENTFQKHSEKIGLSMPPKSLGYLSDSELEEQYLTSKFLAFPSLYEGFGLPVLEAQRFGVPVLATDIPVLREVGGLGSVFFKKGSAHELAKIIKKVVTVEAEFERLSKLAIENESKFSWCKAARETELVFKEALR